METIQYEINGQLWTYFVGAAETIEAIAREVESKGGE